MHLRIGWADTLGVTMEKGGRSWVSHMEKGTRPSGRHCRSDWTDARSRPEESPGLSSNGSECRDMRARKGGQRQYEQCLAANDEMSSGSATQVAGPSPSASVLSYCHPSDGIVVRDGRLPPVGFKLPGRSGAALWPRLSDWPGSLRHRPLVSALGE